MAKTRLTPQQQAILDDNFPSSGEMDAAQEYLAMQGTAYADDVNNAPPVPKKSPSKAAPKAAPKPVAKASAKAAPAKGKIPPQFLKKGK